MNKKDLIIQINFWEEIVNDSKRLWWLKTEYYSFWASFGNILASLGQNKVTSKDMRQNKTGAYNQINQKKLQWDSELFLLNN
jgi:hypothetical protein